MKSLSTLLDPTGAGYSTAAGGATEPLPFPTEVTADLPTGGAPATGIKLFGSMRANRRLPSYVSATGRSERLQPFMGSNEIMLVDVPAGGTLYNTLGVAMAADVGTATTPAITTTNLLTMQPRRVLSVIATAGLSTEAKAAAPICSRRLVGGGFHFTMRFGLETVLPATGRIFAGLSNSTAAISSGDISATIVNVVGLIKNSAESVLKMWTAPAASASGQSIALPNTGSVGWNVAGTMFQVELFCRPGDTVIGYRVTRYTPGATPSTSAAVVVYDEGTLLDTTSALPVIDTLFVPHFWAQNVAATAMSVAFIQMYKESD